MVVGTSTLYVLLPYFHYRSQALFNTFLGKSSIEADHLHFLSHQLPNKGGGVFAGVRYSLRTMISAVLYIQNCTGLKCQKCTNDPFACTVGHPTSG